MGSIERGLDQRDVCYLGEVLDLSARESLELGNVHSYYYGNSRTHDIKCDR